MSARIFATALALIVIVVGVLLSPPGPAESGQPDCEPARPHGTGDFDETIVSGGFMRAYILHIPPSYSGTDAVPLVLNLHGLGGDAHQQASYSALPAKADESGFILVSPEGTETAFLPSRHWNFTTLEQLIDQGTPDDVAFFADLLEGLEHQLCIDSSRVFAAGMSNGAQMSVRLACGLAHRIAAIAPVAAVYFPPWSPLDLAIEPGCLSLRPVPVIAFHGTSDTIVPFKGGELGVDLPFRVRNVETEIVPDWASHNGCATIPSEERVTDNVRLVRYDGCNASAAVALYAIQGGQHQWPGAADLPAPDVSDEISANDLMWSFFVAHPLIVIPGDGDCSGAIDSVDAAVALQFDAGLSATLACQLNADANDDSAVNVIDAALILQFVAGLLESLPPQ